MDSWWLYWKTVGEAAVGAGIWCWLYKLASVHLYLALLFQLVNGLGRDAFRAEFVVKLP